MKRFVISCCSLLFVLLVAGTASAQSRIPGFGSVYFAYDLGTYSANIPKSSTNNWYTPGENFKTPIGLYNLNPQKVDSQIADMRASGLDYVTLHIAMADLSMCKGNGSCNNGYTDWLWGELLDYSQYKLRPQQQANLISILQDIKSRGFRHVIVRFGNYDPPGWSAWQENKYQRAWNTIVSVRNTVYSQLAGGVTSPIFDLDVEALGDPRGQVQAYARRLWSDYTFTYGNDDTVGFSTVGDVYHISNGLSWYGTVKPKMYAFDVYSDVGQGLVTSWKALGAEGAKPIILMETYDNDATTAKQLQGALAANPGLNLIALMQWPQTRNVPCQGCDTNVADSAVQALNTTTQMDNYASIALPVVSEDTNSALLHLVDLNCASTTTPTCTILGALGYQPAGGLTTYQIYVSGVSEPRKLWACNGGGTGAAVASWIKRNFTYRFEYFKVSSCSASIAGSSPAAVSIVSAR